MGSYNQQIPVRPRTFVGRICQRESCRIPFLELKLSPNHTSTYCSDHCGERERKRRSALRSRMKKRPDARRDPVLIRQKMDQMWTVAKAAAAQSGNLSALDAMRSVAHIAQEVQRTCICGNPKAEDFPTCAHCWAIAMSSCLVKDRHADVLIPPGDWFAYGCPLCEGFHLSRRRAGQAMGKKEKTDAVMHALRPIYADLRAYATPQLVREWLARRGRG